MNNIVDIINLNHNGEGIAKINNKVFFIPKTVVGDKVEVKITLEYKNYGCAEVVKYIKNSEKKIEVRCPYFDKCNGCVLSNISYDEELKYKKEKVEDIFRKYLNVDRKFSIIKSENRYEYRNKIELNVENNKLCLHDIHNELFTVNNCLLVDDKINELIKVINSSVDLAKVKRVTIRENSNYEIMIIFWGIVDEVNVLNELKDKAILIISRLNNSFKTLYKESDYIDNIGNYQYKIINDAFFQVNTRETLLLYDKVLEYVNGNKNNRVLDLYCGTGTIGIYLSQYVDKVLGIEINESAVENAKENKRINNVNNIEFMLGDVGKLINSKYDFDIVVVDPPRSGLDKKTKEILLEINPSKIVYVSCDPMTLVRDLKVLMNNYDINDITLFDMFPNTYHVETVVILYRQTNEK